VILGPSHYLDPVLMGVDTDEVSLLFAGTACSDLDVWSMEAQQSMVVGVSPGGVNVTTTQGFFSEKSRVTNPKKNCHLGTTLGTVSGLFVSAGVQSSQTWRASRRHVRMLA
jgi:hypothetical protein